jgi:hypothetical protein
VPASLNVDPARFKEVQLVLRVLRVAPGAADKYAWVRVRILTVLKNETGREFGPELEIAYYSGKPGVPAEPCTVYLEPYSDAPDHPWKLLGGSAVRGVSHVGGAADP